MNGCIEQHKTPLQFAIFNLQFSICNSFFLSLTPERRRGPRMTFRLFIYCCALGGGWAAFLAWGLVRMLLVEEISEPVWRAGLIGGILGLFVASAIGFVDALLN